jgi:hypothetical protein
MITTVIPAYAGIQALHRNAKALDLRIRGDDGPNRMRRAHHFTIHGAHGAPYISPAASMLKPRKART